MSQKKKKKVITLMLHMLVIMGFGPYKVCWKPTRNRGFEDRGYYSSFYPPNLVSFPWRMIWHSKVPPRVAFFSWSASLGKILTIDNLRKRRVIVLDWCYMRKSCGLWFSACLVFNGLCLILFLSCLRFGKESLHDIVTLMFGN